MNGTGSGHEVVGNCVVDRTAVVYNNVDCAIKQ